MARDSLSVDNPRATGLRARMSRAGGLLDHAAREFEVAAGEYAIWRARAYSANDLRYESSAPTGRWRRSVRMIKRSPVVVTQGSLPYRNWIEGTSRANAHSRFKGYWIWRRTRADVERAAVRIMDRVLSRYAGRL